MRKGEYIILNFTQKRKSDLKGSKQANEINSTNKESKADSTGNGKGRARFIFLCEVEEEGFKEARKEHKERNGERVINIHETAKRGSEQQEIMRVNQRNPPPSSGRFISQRVTKSEPRGSAVILDPALTFNPEKSL